MEIDEQSRNAIKRMVLHWPALARVSEEALYLFHMVGHGKKVLLYSPASCFLFDRSDNIQDDSATRARRSMRVDRVHVDELRASGLIAPLSQFGYGNKVGWRELMGRVGEKFDVYLCTQ